MAETLEKQESKIVLPRGLSAPTRKVPRHALWTGLPKSGKTTKLAELPNHLFIDVEKGSDFVECNRIQPPENAGPVAIWKWLKEVIAAIKAEGNPYDHVIIETITYLDELAEWVGTWNYMQSPQGKKFNREGGVAGAKIVKFGTPEYSSVHEVGEGYGYRWSREAMMDIIDQSKNLGRICTHYTGHISDKYVASKTDANTQIRIMEVALTGKLKNVIPKELDAVGYMYQKNGILNVSFKGSEEKIGGMRGASHMQGYDGPIDWNKIFLLDNQAA
jgi:hypothetical protein